MPSQTSRNTKIDLIEEGTYLPPTSTSLRSPCSVINALANHGYIQRSGRNIRYTELKAAVEKIGVSMTISVPLSYVSFLENPSPAPTGFWEWVRNPITQLIRSFGMRDPRQVDKGGKEVLNLDQLAKHGAMEHDVSLTRRDAAQGDGLNKQKDLVDQLIAAARDSKFVTMEDFARLRRKRLEQQRKDNPEMVFEALHNLMACGEVAFAQKLFGDSKRDFAVPVEYVKALWQEERFPFEEGWEIRRWWPLGILETVPQMVLMRKAVRPC